jgi:hypothetical protein
MAGQAQDATWPLPKFYFSVQFGDDKDIHFQEVTGLESEAKTRTSLSPTTPAAFAFQTYLNFDGKGGHFGSTGVSATSDNPDELSIFAATPPTQLPY